MAKGNLRFVSLFFLITVHHHHQGSLGRNLAAEADAEAMGGGVGTTYWCVPPGLLSTQGIQKWDYQLQAGLGPPTWVPKKMPSGLA